MPERLFDDDARPTLRLLLLAFLRQPGAGEQLGDGAVEAGLCRQVEDAVAGHATLAPNLVEPLLEALVPVELRELRLAVVQALRKCLPEGGYDRALARETVDRVERLRAKLVVSKRPARDADNRELRRQGVLQGEIVERRQQLAVREVASGAEDDHDARINRARGAHPCAQRIRLYRGRFYHTCLIPASSPGWVRQYGSQ